MKVIDSNLFLLILLSFLFSACTEPRIKRYEGLLDKKVGAATKQEMDSILGTPVHCKADTGLRKCEYRTTAGRNYPTPQVFRKSKTMRPDVSPYEHFDVLHLFYDEKQVLKEWQPVVIRP